MIGSVLDLPQDVENHQDGDYSRNQLCYLGNYTLLSLLQSSESSISMKQRKADLPRE